MDKHFAIDLGVSPSHWNMIRSRGCHDSPSLLRAVREKFPELSHYEFGGLPEGDSGVVPYWNAYTKSRNSISLSRLSKMTREQQGECYFCGSTEMLHAHHKDLQGQRSDQPNNVAENLVTLCTRCHRKLHALLRTIEGRLRATASNPEIQIIRIKMAKGCGRNEVDLNRVVDMAIRESAGEPMESIGIDYGLSRQRVKQILDAAKVG